ncbi:hypothetical protein DRJ22_03575 [Candidatus Woesearchaeota archaeon]|nr:MAG: hypothetical protein B6U93_00230 [Candidatus Woesearchaeota archaeon ex4484_78]RLE45782.1 MAG: hypothetical protein DRJ22_03575 [Candidatus Woesearchaeota archaeon]
MIRKTIENTSKILFFIFLIMMIGCTHIEKTGNKFLDNAQYCNVNADCTLARTNSGEQCIPVNKLYASKIYAKGIKQDCQKKEVICVNNECIIAEKEEEKLEKCKTDADCAPAECCHATKCVLKSKAPNCEGIMCTMECRQGTLDCGGRCKCIEGTCKPEINN